MQLKGTHLDNNCPLDENSIEAFMLLKSIFDDCLQRAKTALNTIDNIHLQPVQPCIMSSIRQLLALSSDTRTVSFVVINMHYQLIRRLVNQFILN